MINAVVKFSKLNDGAQIPSKRKEDMGFDVYACFDEDYIVIAPHETKLIPTGIASACEPEYGFLLRERGSTGSKGIALRCGVIDSGYRNEWFVGLTNTTIHPLIISKISEDRLREFYLGQYFKDAVIYPYEKAIAQALVIPIPEVKVEEVSYEELQAIKSERGLGALGSSGK